jgi:tetratricopeptide (TPR) repeat protein
MKRKRSPLSLILTTLLFCLASSCKDANKTILKTPNEEPSISIFNSETDSIYITKTKLFYNQFLQLKQTDTQNELSAIILDSTLSNYRKIKNKKASLAYPIYKDTWEYYIDRFEHSKAIATIEEFIEISKTDTNGDQIKLLEAYSYLGSELTYSGQCDTAIEKSFKPFLTLLEKEVSKTNDPDEIAFLKTGEIATYVGYLDCANILGDGNLQKKILKKSEELIVERHDDIPWYNVYKSDLLGMMSTLYLSMGDLSKAKIFLELYEGFMEPQDIIDEILLGDRKMSFFSEIQDIKKFDREFEISKTNYKKALTIFPPNTEESLLAISNHYLAFERKALLLAKKDPLDKEIPKLYHKAMEMIALVPNDARMNPLNSYRGMISYYDTFPKKDSMLFFFRKVSGFSY